jgi:hypothetical protein
LNGFTAKWRPAKLWDIETPQNQYDAELTLREAGAVLLVTAGIILVGVARGAPAHGQPAP